MALMLTSVQVLHFENEKPEFCKVLGIA